ncbi:endopeptidase DegP/Do [Ameyamaea chiangmaiensis NBRC 103196]|uniref:Probable periplasmic serine endoprotease DegP-like n=1 Tax=Ameyamaea chiangmaiensis TaxID=442969 RepID=A0A850PAZ2_9PROT|nr:Do family serine endopeptidase [Ameyamaea chiangmaiensis]MBS4075240.1 Do family serine endopeptidase [Ameyamaea chiangmaiensis]NVN41244.1 Do family serine endopeptidase [Ameyamaea chiangmaiensis]GBQ66509.1 endopeptidase DegP/Do [Ameyamaea chiangmaiensis NBRC 103196]
MPHLPLPSPVSPARTLRTLLAATALLGAGALATPPARADDAGAIKPNTQVQTLPNFVALVKQVKPAVVSITSHITESDDDEQQQGGMEQQQSPFPFPFPFQMMPQQPQHRSVEARGSGFLISADGYVVTNNHVVKGATKVSVTLDDGTSLPAKIVGRDPKTDLALLKIAASSRLPFIELGESDNVQPGEWVVAVGNPYGLGGTVTAGIVSARGRDIGDGPYDSFIQIDAPINRGNSGGPLFTQDGKVVGVNTAILSPSGGSIGIGFAIPSDTVRNVVDQLRKTGHVTRGYLGVEAQQISPAMAKALGLKPPTPGAPPSGALIATTNKGGPADLAGVKAGDVVTTLNGQKIDSPHDLAVKVSSLQPGTDATLGVIRNGTAQSLHAKIVNMSGTGGDTTTSAAADSDTSSGKIGVSLSALTPDLRHRLGVDDSVHGVVIAAIKPGSPAGQAGLRPGDIIQGVGNRPVDNPRATVAAVRDSIKTNQSVLLRILRDGQALFVAIDPSSQGDDGGSGDDNN